MNKVIFWDFDGTLGFRKDGMWGASMLEALKRHDPSTTVTAPDFRPYLIEAFPWHNPDIPNAPMKSPEEWWKPILERFASGYEHCGVERELAVKLAHEAREIFIDLDRWMLFDDTLETLIRLRHEGWSHAIVSNHIPELRRIAGYLRLLEHIDYFVNSAEVGYEKPNRAIFEHALKLANHPSIVWMVGDNFDADYTGAEAAGIPAVLIRTGDTRAARRGSNMEEAARWILSWKEGSQ